MASLIFAHSKAIVNRAKKHASNIASMMEESGHDYQEVYDKTYNSYLKSEMTNFDQYLEVSSMLHKRYLDKIKPPSDKAYFITIRPDDSKISFSEFKDKVTKYLQRKCFISYTLSFEQKGTSIDEMGKGFHCHIVAKMKQGSKAEVLRDTLSTWNDWIQNKYIYPNCIEVLITNNPEKLVEQYLVEYISEDDHKAATKSTDSLWREQNNIQNIYIYPTSD